MGLAVDGERDGFCFLLRVVWSSGINAKMVLLCSGGERQFFLFFFVSLSAVEQKFVIIFSLHCRFWWVLHLMCNETNTKCIFCSQFLWQLYGNIPVLQTVDPGSSPTCGIYFFYLTISLFRTKTTVLETRTLF